MDHRDAQLSEITVVLDKRWDNNFKDALEKLKTAGMSISVENDDQNVVEGVISSHLVKSLEAMDCVDYVRVCFSWIADYPKGDPRNLDEDELES